MAFTTPSVKLNQTPHLPLQKPTFVENESLTKPQGFMKILLIIFLFVCLCTTAVQAQDYDVRNYRAYYLGGVGVRTAYFKVDSTGELSIGNSSSKETRKGIELILQIETDACIDYTSRQLSHKKSKELYEIRGIGYQYLNEYGKAIGILSRHWLFSRMTPF